jgi:serine protease Do
MVTLRCGSSLGSGFFVSQDLVLTDARLTCPPGEPFHAVFANGRESAAAPEQEDGWLGLGLVRVPRANAEPLPLGDSTALRPGDHVVFVGAPAGAEPAVYEGTVSHGARSVFGIAFLKIDKASGGLGAGGGPLLDMHGRVVGIVSPQLETSGGLGFVLPINYAYSGIKHLIPPPAEPAPDDQSWNRMLVDVADADRKEVKRVASQSGRPALLSLTSPEGKGLVAVVAQRSARRTVQQAARQSPAVPRAETFTFVFRNGDRTLCKVTAAADNWRQADASSDTAETGADSRYMQWMRKNNLQKDVFLGFATLDVKGCPLEELHGAQVVLEGADERADRVGV